MLLVLLIALAAPFAPPEDTIRPPEDLWDLAFQDDFERTEVGENWVSNDAAIVSGRLLIGANHPACAKITTPFPGDVKVEFIAQAYERKPPCDLSVTLAAERLSTMSWNYLLAFGGVNNTVNKLTGGRKLRGMRDEHPERLIEPGRVYHIEAVKEGKRLTMHVDGILLLSGEDEEIMGGPGFDAVGLVTWNGMYVDNVRVYERALPHPDTPRYVTKLGGLVARTPPGTSLEEAERVIRDEPESELKAAGLAAVYGNLSWDERPGDFPRLARLFADVAEKRPDDKRLADYAWAASIFARIRIFPRDVKACSQLMALGSENNPFYDKAKLYRARFLRASGQEGADRGKLATARRMFEELKRKAPDHVILRQLTGERIPWGEDLIHTDPRCPRWAALLGELYERQLRILQWWFAERQFPDGQLGGGWGDDVEILRSWGPFAVISNARPAVHAGIERLCQGVWDLVLVDGFDPGFGDVEHSAEPSADTIPTMLALKHGDPVWYERNLTSCRRIRDYYTGRDKKGYMRFKSAFFGGDRVGTSVREGGDSYYSSRPMKHLLWAAWYGNQDARDFYLNWVTGWVEATMTTTGTKLAGIPPANIWYPSGEITPPNGAPWNDPDYNYMARPWLANFWIQDSFLAGYALTKDPRFLRPFHTFMAWQESSPPAGAPAHPDIDDHPLAWAISQAKGGLMGPTLGEYRWLTADSSYDAVLIPRVRPAHHLQLTGDMDRFVDHLERQLGGLRTNFDLLTREVLQTDRAGLPGAALTFGAYTGGVRAWGDAGVPTMAVTWDVPHASFAALVLHASTEHLRVRLYNFRNAAMQAGMRLWHLVPGRYVVRRGIAGAGPREIQWSAVDSFTLEARADPCRLTIPPRRDMLVDLRLEKRIIHEPVLPDPAIAPNDVTRETGGAIRVTVHNLGSTPVTDLIVAIRSTTAEVARGSIPVLPACRDLTVSTASITFSEAPAPGRLQVVLDPDRHIPELNEQNNRTEVTSTP